MAKILILFLMFALNSKLIMALGEFNKIISYNFKCKTCVFQVTWHLFSSVLMVRFKKKFL